MRRCKQLSGLCFVHLDSCETMTNRYFSLFLTFVFKIIHLSSFTEQITILRTSGGVCLQGLMHVLYVT